ncbi:MAG TPA: hypothetical protein VGO95_01120 [Modestobacter sp.]|nr:hypothetical protein [Modestobacter sp.]
MTDSRTGVHRAPARDTGTARPRPLLAVLLVLAGVAVFVTGLSLGWWSVRGRTVASTDWSSLGLVPDDPTSRSADPPGLAEAAASNGVAGLLLVVMTEVREPVQQDVVIDDDDGWKLCSPALAGELGTTP